MEGFIPTVYLSNKIIIKSKIISDINIRFKFSEEVACVYNKLYNILFIQQEKFFIMSNPNKGFLELHEMYCLHLSACLYLSVSSLVSLIRDEKLDIIFRYLNFIIPHLYLLVSLMSCKCNNNKNMGCK